MISVAEFKSMSSELVAEKNGKRLRHPLAFLEQGWSPSSACSPDFKCSNPSSGNKEERETPNTSCLAVTSDEPGAIKLQHLKIF